MCLLIVLAQTHPGLPLVVAANRDERFDRAAVAMSVLREAGPRTLGGQDLVAGGTWLAVNEAGVVAGLTNRPATKDPARRSRGELPIALTAHTSAAAAAEALASDFRPADYNPAWLLVGDRETAYAIDMTGGEAPRIRQLSPGAHVLENRPLEAASSKTDHVRSLLAGTQGLDEEELVSALQAVLSDHRIPAGLAAAHEAGIEGVPPEVKAACVHTELYGTRWSGIVTVPADPASPPRVRYADGPACRSRYQDATPRWCVTPAP